MVIHAPCVLLALERRTASVMTHAVHAYTVIFNPATDCLVDPANLKIVQCIIERQMLVAPAQLTLSAAYARKGKWLEC